jgi:hypothetical protein
MDDQIDQLAALRAAHVASHHEQEAKLLRGAIEATGGGLRATARHLGCREATLRLALTRHPELRPLVRTRADWCAQPYAIAQPATHLVRSTVRTKRATKQTGPRIKHKTSAYR